jgi:Asp-tRNA(Asn)/Glu-tRNA(Gln) amidotransferase A subunit family amidase
MDRRRWLQLLAILSAAPAGAYQRGGQQPVALRISKDQLIAGLKLIGIEFPDAELEMMMRRVNTSLGTYEALRKQEIPYGTEPACAFHPGLPGRKPIAGPQRFSTTISPAATVKAPPDLETVAFWPVAKLAPLVRSRAVSSTDLTRMYLGRMKKYGPQLLCLITLTEELALEQAAAADRAIRAGRYRGPLHGIPYGLKDLFDTKGIRTTWGAEPFQQRVPERNATVVERLGKAGAVLIAKLSMGALAQGDLWFGGRTKNPWNLEQGSSGSSAGSAAATAAGLVGFALGTETLGSVVSPCTQCGTAGLRPTYGRVSRYGAMALSWTMDKIGPICRGVEDLALVLNGIYGPDGHDRTVAADPFHWEPRRALAGMKIGVLQSAFDRMQGDNKKIYDQALEDLKKAGVAMKPAEFTEDQASIRFLLEAEAAAAFDDITLNGEVRTLKGQAQGDWPNSFRSSRLVPAVEYIRAQRVRTLLVERFEKFMADWDALVIPSQALLTTTNLTGNPQVVVKCGFAEATQQNGSKVPSPRTISFLGRIYEEGSPLRVALAYERATDWNTRHPELA